MSELAIRPLELDEVGLIPDYFLAMNEDQLRGMGVDPPKLPARDAWTKILVEDFARPVKEKHFFYLLWLIDGQVAGHSNINKIEFGDHAFSHLHLWHAENRRKGFGVELLKRSAQEYFKRFELDSVLSEPFAGNPSPNRTLPKAGFELVKTYDTLPGWINYHQTVNRWQLKRSSLERPSVGSGTT